MTNAALQALVNAGGEKVKYIGMDNTKGIILNTFKDGLTNDNISFETHGGTDFVVVHAEDKSSHNMYKSYHPTDCIQVVLIADESNVQLDPLRFR